MTTPWKNNNNLFSPFRDFDRFLIYIDKKQHEITQKPVSSDKNWVQNDFSTICGSEDMNTLFLADHVTFVKRP